MLTTIVQVQQGIYDKAYDSLVTQYQSFWMNTDCTPPPKYEIMAPVTPDARPGVRRLRSNSVPIAVSLMDCTAEEAGLLFSAAEKASARRRKAQSFDDCTITPLTEDPRRSNSNGPIYEDIEDNEDDNCVETVSSHSHQEPTTPSLLGSEDSTPMVSPGIKGYNDDMVKFVKQRLQDIAYTYCSPPSTKPQPKQIEPESTYSSTPQRPALQSHFSNWSITSPDDEDDESDVVDLASSPAATEDSPYDDADDKNAEMGQAHIVQFRQRSDMERSVPRCYFSWPARERSKAGPRPVTFDTPITAELQTADIGKASTPLIDLDASQPQIGRYSRDADFFDFGFSNDRRLTPSPSPAGSLSTLPQYIGQAIPSPRPVVC